MSEIRRTSFHDISTSNHGERGAPPLSGGDISHAPVGRVSIARPGKIGIPPHTPSERCHDYLPHVDRGFPAVALHRHWHRRSRPHIASGPGLTRPKNGRISQMISIETVGLGWVA